MAGSAGWPPSSSTDEWRPKSCRARSRVFLWEGLWTRGPNAKRRPSRRVASLGFQGLGVISRNAHHTRRKQRTQRTLCEQLGAPAHTQACSAVLASQHFGSSKTHFKRRGPFNATLVVAALTTGPAPPGVVARSGRRNVGYDSTAHHFSQSFRRKRCA